MERRTFIAGLTASLVASLAAEAQPPRKVARVGYLSPSSKVATNVSYTAFRQALRDLGYVEGQTLLFEERFADGELERLPALASELVRLKVDVIVAVAAPAIQAVRDATPAIPIVMAFSGADPVRSGFVASLGRPGGNITGLTILVDDLSVKWLELLREAIPGIERVGVLTNPSNPGSAFQVKNVQAAARTIGVKLIVAEARSPDQYESALGRIANERAKGVIVLADPMFTRDRERLASLTTKHRLPAVRNWREFAEAGWLMSYGPNLSHMAQRAASYVDKILKGAKPADLPVEQPMKFELVINLKTAKALGLTIPQSLLLRADQVIQ